MSQRRTSVTRQAKHSVGSYELVLSSLIFGLGGWWLDRRLGTTPILACSLATVGFVGSACSLYYRYKARMILANEERMNHRASGSTAAGEPAAVPAEEAA
ncbi:MAG: AtpZ/AtpI family protein [Acidimicrobiales bacterium]